MPRETVTPIRALVIRPDESWEVIEVLPELDAMIAVVGGYLERVTCRMAAFYLDEDGKTKAQPPNAAATVFARYCGLGLAPDDIMVGTVMVLGSAVSGVGDETPVTDETLDLWTRFANDLAATRAERQP